MTPADVDAVILNYRTFALTVQCARSVQSNGAGSIVVVDNDSQDGCGDKLEAELGGFARVLRLASNGGFSAGNNRGAREGDAPLLLFVNSDVVLPPGALAAMVDVLNRETRAGIVAPALAGSDGRAQASAYRFISPAVILQTLLGLDKLARKLGWAHLGGNVDLGRNGDYSGRVESLYGPCLLVRRQAFEQVGGFDENFFLYCEETDLILRLARAGWQAFRTAATTVLHVHNQSAGQLPARSLVLMNESNRYYAGKHFGWGGRTVTALAFAFGLTLRWVLARRPEERRRYLAALGVWL
jgi:N-acetylglucosaminyl-diphospho-decaprenol L-rhamnosyltransferase